MLETNVNDLHARIDVLRQEKSNLKSYIDETKKNFVETTQQIMNNTQSAIGELGTKSQQEIVQISNSTQSNIKNVHDTARLERDNTISKIENLVSNIENASVEFGKMEALIPIFEIMKGEQISKERGFPPLLSFLYRIQNWDQIQSQYYLKNCVINLINEVRKHLTIIPA